VVAATENHYVTHEVWLFGQFDWKRYLPDVEADVRIARETKQMRTGSTYDVQGLHGWLEYTNGLLGRGKAEPPAPAAARAIRVEAEDAVSITTPLSIGEDGSAGRGKYVGVAAAEARPASESITSFRDFVSPTASATYRIEIPADGAYAFRAACWWPTLAGGFTVLVDESNMRDEVLHPSKEGTPRSWTVEKLPAPLYLGVGSHTVRIVGRTPGARIDWFELAPAPANTSSGSR
jgi:hypothetical protein